jgi:hypothetical protein
MVGIYQQFYPDGPLKKTVHVPGYIFPPDAPASLDSPQNNETDLIKHDLIDLLGQTTNALIFCFLDNHVNERFTRAQIRAAVECHVAELKKKGVEEQYLARIQTGKAAVNYWIDRLVENNSLVKKHSKPVLFWRNASYQSKTKSRNILGYPNTSQSLFSSNRGA